MDAELRKEFRIDLRDIRKPVVVEATTRPKVIYCSLFIIYQIG